MIDRRTPSGRVAVIGAGVAGLTCAGMLKDAGLKPTVFEKSRGLGGRMANRRAGDGLAFDHGAQYVTARGAGFQARIREAIEGGYADVWRPESAVESQAKWIVGKPGMSALVKPMAQDLDIRLGARVSRLERRSSGWRVVITDADAGEPFDVVVSTLPAPQAQDLVPDENGIGDAIAAVSIAPCWALMLALETPLECQIDVQRSASGDLSWIARNSAKPGRNGAPDCWVAHASPNWSAHNLEWDENAVLDSMLHMLPSAVGVALPAISYAAVHRWRYAMTIEPLGVPFLHSEDETLFVGGDWCLGARVESAFDSGQAIARAIFENFGRS